jgi:hypothetical protein
MISSVLHETIFFGGWGGGNILAPGAIFSDQKGISKKTSINQFFHLF